jgi:hypothetical protein
MVQKIISAGTVAILLTFPWQPALAGAKVTHTDITITKHIDKSSPTLQKTSKKVTMGQTNPHKTRLPGKRKPPTPIFK